MPNPREREELHQRATVHPADADEWLSTQRKLLAVSLNDVVTKVRTALDDAGLPVEVFFTIPSSGEALLRFATPTDPSDPDWAPANQIVCDIVGSVIGIEGLRSRSLPRASSGIAISTAEVPFSTGEPVGLNR